MIGGVGLMWSRGGGSKYGYFFIQVLSGRWGRRWNAFVFSRVRVWECFVLTNQGKRKRGVG